MLEPDHVLVRSVPLTGVSLGHPLGFFFSCARPHAETPRRPTPSRKLPCRTRHDKHVATGTLTRWYPRVSVSCPDVNFEDHLEALTPHLKSAGCSAKAAPRSGNSPALMHRDDLKKVSPAWSEISIALHGDEKAREEEGGGAAAAGHPR